MASPVPSSGAAVPVTTSVSMPLNADSGRLATSTAVLPPSILAPHLRLPGSPGGGDLPGFVVEDMTEAQERALRQELRAWRRPDDEFIYEIVVVPSFEDAVIAAERTLAAAREQQGKPAPASP